MLLENIPRDDIIVTFLNGWCLFMVRCYQLVFQSRDCLNALLFESLEASVESLLFGEESLYGGQVTAIVIGSYLGLFVSCKNDTYIYCQRCDNVNSIASLHQLSFVPRSSANKEKLLGRDALNEIFTDPALNYISLPDELEEGRVVDQSGLAARGSILQGVEVLLEILASLIDQRGVMVALRNKNDTCSLKKCVF